MTYRVIVTPEAEAGLRAAYEFIRARAPRAARDWVRRARQAMRSLSRYPERCAFAPESETLGEPIRELLFGAGSRGTYRILFVVIGQTVYVVNFRHGSMLPLGSEQSE